MTRPNFKVFLVFCSIFAVCNGFGRISGELRNDFRNLAIEKMNHLLKSGIPLEQFLTLQIALTDCQSAANVSTIHHGWKQTILEEETCGTTQIQKWCLLNPGNLGMMTVTASNRSALARFQCRYGHPFPHPHNSVFMIINYITLFSFVGMTYCWYKTCSRPKPMHPSKILDPCCDRHQESDSFESITFDTSRNLSKNLSRSSYTSGHRKFKIVV